MRKSLISLLLVPLFGVAQIGGTDNFNATTLINNARAAGLGGKAVSLTDGDLTQFFDNPSILDSAKVASASFMINPYFTDATFYSVASIFSIKKQKIAAGLNYMNYGNFEMTDATGIITGTFQAKDYQVVLGGAHRLGPISLGINLKFLSASIESYSSNAIAADLGGIFSINPNWSIGMVFENMGWVLSDFANTTSMKLPFDVRMGTTFQPTYMPFRFTITSNSLVSPVIVQEEETNSGIDRALRRVSIGTEILFSKSFQVLLGYNHHRKQELKLEETSGGAGFSYGFMLRVNRFYLRFSRMAYHAAGGTSFISVQTDFNDFKKIL